MILRVVVSESGEAQTDFIKVKSGFGLRHKEVFDSGTQLESWTTEVIVLYTKLNIILAVSRVSRDWRNLA